MINPKKLFLLVLLAVSSTTAVLAQKLTADIPAAYKNDTTYAFLDSTFGHRIPASIRVVGLGDVAYTAAEPVDFSKHMIQYLVEKKGFRTILLPRNNWGMRRLNHYLTSNAASNADIEVMLVKEVTKNTIHNTREFAALLGWIKVYNLRHVNDPVILKGMNFFPPPTIIYLMSRYIMPHDSLRGIEMMKGWSTKLRNDTFALAQVQQWAADKAAIHARQPWYQELTDDLENIGNCKKWMLNENMYNGQVFFDSCMARQAVAATADEKKTIIWGDNEMISRIKLHKQQEGKNFGLLLTDMQTPFYSILTDFSGKANIHLISENKFGPAERSAGKASAAYLLKLKYPDNGGILFPDDFTRLQVPPLFNIIDIYGQDVTYSTSDPIKPFDALVLFTSLTPTSFLNQ
ncbi:TraB/GumN family protein [Chitinophaga arvensicola]|uniref:Erythromycin esterase homolog n=1 Tax=Chitinophaga arvensicola TaxID=29529 RepID=A0A1I0SAF0_9BACT|nr:hypothetical protein [Chitinophaga arvensicola]SEW53473.1 hypothetical protein SAMN04488122_5481 [Chitinophaga arvensicola]